MSIEKNDQEILRELRDQHTERLWMESAEAQLVLERIRGVQGATNAGTAPRWLLLLAAAVSVAVVATFATLWLPDEEAEAPRPMVPLHSTRIAGYPSGYTFVTLAQLAATSEVIVEGTVVSAGKGHLLHPDEPGLYVREVVLEVDHQFKGAVGQGRITIDLLGYNDDSSFELHDTPWVLPGDEVVYFLVDTDSRPQGHYTLVKAPGQIILRDGVARTAAEDPVARVINGLTSSELTERIKSAIDEAGEQNIQPLPGAPK